MERGKGGVEAVHSNGKASLVHQDSSTRHHGSSVRRDDWSCFQRLMVKMSIVKETDTPVSWAYLFMAFMALFSSSITLTFLFPFLPEMIKTFGYAEEDKGKYGGYIAGCVFAGRFFGSLFWGWLADRFGSKLVLLITIFLNGLFAGLFGFSHNIWLACFFRFMCGVVNGTIGTGKAIIGAISDDTNQAVCMSFLSVSWAFGLILGPLAGGLLASPASKYPEVFDPDGIFGQFPYLLPSLVPFVVCVLIFVLILLKFDENFILEHKRKKAMSVSDGDEQEQDKTTLNHEHNLRKPLFSGETWTSHRSLHNLGQSIQSLNLEYDPISVAVSETCLRQQEKANAAGTGYVRSLSHPAGGQPTSEEDDLINIVGIESDISKSTPNVTYLLSKDDSSLMFSTENELHTRDVYSEHDIANNTDSSDIHKNCERNGSIKRHSKTNGSVHRKANNIDSLIQEHHGETNVNGSCTTYLQVNGAQVGNGQMSKENLEKLLEHAEEDVENICECMVWCCDTPCCRPATDSSLAKLLRYADVWATIMAYTVVSFVVIAVDDIFPVFASTEPGLGGMGFSTDEIGVAVGAMTLPLLLIQVKLYPFLVNKMGIRKTFLASCVLNLILIQVFPLVRLLNDQRPWLWLCLLLIQIPFKICVNCSFASTSILINNSSPKELSGLVNGLAMMTTAFGRTLAPILGGGLFTWTVTYGPSLGVPFDTSFPFFVLGMFFIITTIQVLCLNPKLDLQKK